MPERTTKGAGCGVPPGSLKRLEYDQVARKYLQWRYGVPPEMADWILQQDAQHSVRAEAEEMAAFIVDECRGL